MTKSRMLMSSLVFLFVIQVENLKAILDVEVCPNLN